MYDANLLAPRERKQLLDLRRLRFEEAYETEDFTLCLGPGVWLQGDAARNAHFRWYGIPSALIDEWEAERKAA